MDYQGTYDAAHIRSSHQKEVERVCQKIMAHRFDYEKVEQGSRVPWYVVAAIHNLEGSLNFNTHLHNGDPLRARTIHVPAGRPHEGTPPFRWYESAIDALSDFAKPSPWTIAAILNWLEGYNGLGYRRRGIPSPYLWSFTSIYQSGKYVADGHFDPNAVSEQVGAVCVFKWLEAKGLVKLIRAPGPQAA